MSFSLVARTTTTHSSHVCKQSLLCGRQATVANRLLSRGSSSIGKRYRNSGKDVLPKTKIHTSAPKSQSSLELAAYPASQRLVAAVKPAVEAPTSAQLKALFVASAIPLVGFGFMDNFVMIQAGGLIDSTIGVQFGLATMTAAAMGQVVSDVSGVVFGGALERFLNRIGLIKAPTLTSAQRALPLCRNIAMAGGVVGVIFGCSLGAATLFFMDLEIRERAENVMQLRDIVTDIISDQDPNAGLPCQSCQIHLTSASGLTDAVDTANKQTVVDVLQDNSSSLATQCAEQGDVIVDNNVLFAPIISNNQVLAVAEFQGKEGVGFTPEDERTAKIMARHIAIFMGRLGKSE